MFVPYLLLLVSKDYVQLSCENFADQKKRKKFCKIFTRKK